MTDKELFKLFRLTLAGLLVDQGVPVPVVKGYAPTKQGREPHAVYFFPIAEPARGWQGRKYVYDEPNSQLVTEENQVFEMTLQIQGFAPEVDGMTVATAGDLTKLARMLIVSNGFTRPLAALGVTVQQPTGVRSIFFTNDYEQYEPNPSFDVTVSYNRTITQNTPAVDRLQFDLSRV